MRDASGLGPCVNSLLSLAKLREIWMLDVDTGMTRNSESEIVLRCEM